MASIRLLGLRISVYTRIARLALEEKKVDYELQEVDIFADAGPPDPPPDAREHGRQAGDAARRELGPYDPEASRLRQIRRDAVD